VIAGDCQTGYIPTLPGGTAVNQRNSTFLLSALLADTLTSLKTSA